MLYPGEVTQYQGQNLTSVADFIEELNLHPDVSIDGTQYIDQSTYRLAISGLVNQTMEYTYEDLVNNFQSYQIVATLLCVEGWSVTILWQGVRLNDLLQEAGVNQNATTLIFNASDGYTTALPLELHRAKQHNLSLQNEQRHPHTANGWPLMLVAQNMYGYKWIMWLAQSTCQTTQATSDTGKAKDTPTTRQ